MLGMLDAFVTWTLRGRYARGMHEKTIVTSA